MARASMARVDPAAAVAFEELKHSIDATIAALLNGRRLIAQMERGLGDERCPGSHAHHALGNTMTVTEAAQFLAVRPEKVRRLLREGMLLGDRHTCGLGWRVTRRYVEQLAEQRWHRLE